MTLKSVALYDNKFRWGKVWLMLLTAAWLPAIATAAPAPTDSDVEEERWYQVELIIFAHRDREALHAENWPDIEGLKLPEHLAELSLPQPEPAEDASEQTAAEAPLAPPPTTADTLLLPMESGEAAAAMPVAFQILPETQWQLADIEKKLKRSSKYQPLLHVAWRQPTYDEDRAQTVLLYDGVTDPLPAELQSAAETGSAATVEPTQPVAEAPQVAIPASAADADTGALNPRVAGTVRLSVARYLHLDADLVYRERVMQQSAVPVSDLTLWYDRPYATLSDPQGPAFMLEEWQALRGFRLLESRRMRSREIHYLDHPFFGVIALVTPVELPQPEEETEATPSDMQSAPASLPAARPAPR